MGMHCEVSVASADDIENADLDDLMVSSGTATATAVSLEKSWHGLHFLLTGEAWRAEGPLAFLVTGGEEVGDDEESPLRWFTPEETVEIDEALSRVSDNKLWSRFDPEAMSDQDIYPGIWDEDEADLREEYLDYFRALKSVVAEAVDQSQGLLIAIQ
jgi:hypothetical protein